MDEEGAIRKPMSFKRGEGEPPPPPPEEPFWKERPIDLGYPSSDGRSTYWDRVVSGFKSEKQWWHDFRLFNSEEVEAGHDFCESIQALIDKNLVEGNVVDDYEEMMERLSEVYTEETKTLGDKPFGLRDVLSQEGMEFMMHQRYPHSMRRQEYRAGPVTKHNTLGFQQLVERTSKQAKKQESVFAWKMIIENRENMFLKRRRQQRIAFRRQFRGQPIPDHLRYPYVESQHWVAIRNPITKEMYRVFPYGKPKSWGDVRMDPSYNIRICWWDIDGEYKKLVEKGELYKEILWMDPEKWEEARPALQENMRGDPYYPRRNPYIPEELGEKRVKDLMHPTTEAMEKMAQNPYDWELVLGWGPESFPKKTGQENFLYCKEMAKKWFKDEFSTFFKFSKAADRKVVYPTMGAAGLLVSALVFRGATQPRVEIPRTPLPAGPPMTDDLQTAANFNKWRKSLVMRPPDPKNVVVEWDYFKDAPTIEEKYPPGQDPYKGWAKKQPLTFKTSVDDYAHHAAYKYNFFVWNLLQNSKYEIHPSIAFEPSMRHELEQIRKEYRTQRYPTWHKFISIVQGLLSFSPSKHFDKALRNMPEVSTQSPLSIGKPNLEEQNREEKRQLEEEVSGTPVRKFFLWVKKKTEN